MINITGILTTSTRMSNRAIAVEAYERFIQDRIDAEHSKQWAEYVSAESEYHQWAKYHCDYIANVTPYLESEVRLSSTPQSAASVTPAQPLRKIAEPQGRVRTLPENLHDALRKAAKFVATKPRLPVLGNVLISEGTDSLYITAHNIEYMYRTAVGCKVSRSKVIEKINTTIPAKTALEYLALADMAEPISLTQYNRPDKGLCLNVAQSTHSANFYTIDADEFPTSPDAETGQYIGTIIKPTEWIAALKAVGQNTAKDDNRPIIQGVLVETFANGTARVAATDGYKLSLHQLTLDAEKDCSLIVPGKALMSVISLLEKDRSIDLVTYRHANETYISFKQGADEYILQTISGKFPLIDMVIPKNFTTCITADLDGLLKALKGRKWDKNESLSLTVEQRHNCYEMGSLIIRSAEYSESGDLEYKQDVRVEGQGFNVGLNASYLITLLKSLSETTPAEKRIVSTLRKNGKSGSKTVTEPRWIEIQGKDESNPIQIMSGHQLTVLMPASLER